MGFYAVTFVQEGRTLPHRIVSGRVHDHIGGYPATVVTAERVEETAAFRYKDEAEAYVAWLNSRCQHGKTSSHWDSSPPPSLPGFDAQGYCPGPTRTVTGTGEEEK
jgi:hypothetical protein